MVSDKLLSRTYAVAMEQGQPFIRLKLDTEQPIELGEFVGAFTAIAAEYDRYIKKEKPDADPSATLFIHEVRAGCIEADLIPWIAGAAAAGIGFLAAANTIHEFVERYGSSLGFYRKKGARSPDATVAQLRDFHDQVAAIAGAPNSALRVAAMEVVNGKEKTRIAFQFDTAEARAIRDHVDEHRSDLEKRSNADHPRVLMRFTRCDISKAKIGKPSGERVRIEAVGGVKSLPLIYASSLAEDRIKHEISEAEENVFKKGFVVDVNVEMSGDRPVAYRVTEVHQVIDLPEDDA